MFGYFWLLVYVALLSVAVGIYSDTLVQVRKLFTILLYCSSLLLLLGTACFNLHVQLDSYHQKQQLLRSLQQ